MMMKQWDTLDAIERHPDIVSGAWVFRGTRVPVAALFENLRDGATIEQFLERISGSRRQRDASLPGTLWVQHDNTQSVSDYPNLVLLVAHMKLLFAVCAQSTFGRAYSPRAASESARPWPGRSGAIA